MNALSVKTNEPERFRLRVQDFVMLEDSGAFADRSKAELLDGEVIVLNAQYARHGIAKVRLLVALSNGLEALESDLQVYSEVSLEVAPDSMPEPDLFIAPKQGFGYVRAEGVALVVEIADTTLATDLGRKARLYAAAGIPEYWVVDLNAARILVHIRPEDCGYAGRVEHPFGATLEPAALAGVRVPTAALLC